MKIVSAHVKNIGSNKIGIVDFVNGQKAVLCVSVAGILGYPGKRLSNNITHNWSPDRSAGGDFDEGCEYEVLSGGERKFVTRILKQQGLELTNVNSLLCIYREGIDKIVEKSLAKAKCGICGCICAECRNAVDVLKSDEFWR